MEGSYYTEKPNRLRVQKKKFLEGKVTALSPTSLGAFNNIFHKPLPMVSYAALPGKGP